ncbi:MAG: inositol monophosphatase [Anaerolineae bacterium]|nr:inositol monophosphatase [Anaerolineae bacterium]
MNQLLDICLEAAREAGRSLAHAYRQPHQVIVKGLRDITTEADLQAEAISMQVIRDRWPEAVFVSEESHHAKVAGNDKLTWYIDPLDGTTNYARGLPGFSVSVAVALSEQVLCGAVFDPMLDQMFYAERGKGAFLNGGRLQVSACSELGESLVLLDWPREQGLRETSARFLARLAPRVDTVRSRGSAALGICSVAAGWADVYFQYTLKSWDVAAGLLMVEEAGGMASGLRGDPGRLTRLDWLFSNGQLHQAILDMDPYA